MEIIKTSWPGVYSANFIEAGLVSYEDSDDGILYVPKPAIDKMLASFIGKPVCIKHHKITAENYEELRKQGIIVGNVIKVWFNQQDGWFWCDFVVDTQSGRDRIEKEKDSVSCAYSVLDAKEGGIWHDIKYDGELIDGAFTHLALVDSPRYEGAKITKQIPAMLVNGKSAHYFINREETDMKLDLKTIIDNIWNKKPDGTKEKADPVLVLNGKEFPLSEVLNALGEKFNAEGEMKGVQAKDDMLVDINGHSYKINELKNALKNWKPANEKKNCDCTPKDGMHAENCPMYEKTNESEEEKMKKEEAKENARLNAKAEELGKTVEEVKAMEKAEKANSKDPVQTEKIKQLEIENARLKKEKEGLEAFNALEELANSRVNEEISAAPAPKSRSERAAGFKGKVSKQFVGAK